MAVVIGPKSCAVNERTGDGRSVGRCWMWTGEDGICPRHGDVKTIQARFAETGKLTDECDLYEYEVTQGPRKAWMDADTPPPGEGWERDLSRGDRGFERFEFHEESYWMRRRK